MKREPPKCYESRLVLTSPARPGETTVIVKVYQARSKYEAIGKAIAKQMPSYAGYYLRKAVAYHTTQKPLQ